MSNMAVVNAHIPAMSDKAIDRARELEDVLMHAPQVEIHTGHVIHAGMYARTVFLPAGIRITGALIKCATLLVLHGKVSVYIGDEIIDLDGYNVIPASANRKQVFIAVTDTYLTMIFPTNVKTVEEAEAEFTDESELLASRRVGQNHTTITRE